jgi:hypothetical protein
LGQNQTMEKFDHQYNKKINIHNIKYIWYTNIICNGSNTIYFKL